MDIGNPRTKASVSDMQVNHMAALLSLVNEWLVRGLVLGSLAAYLVLLLLGGARRRRASGWQMLLLWSTYQLAQLAATQALAKLSLGSTPQELQLVAFWTPFLLMYLVGPDNISAYSVEDNVLAGRQVLHAIVQVALAIYALNKHIVAGGNAGTLLPASLIMFVLGIAKYLEGAVALWKGNLGSIRSSLKGLKPKGLSFDLKSGGEDLDKEQALLVAQDLFYVTKGAFTDHSFGRPPKRGRTPRKEFSQGCKGVRKMVEMELSLMYDIMYTKAAVVHTGFGYGIRFASPLFTATALSLFWLHSKDGQRRADVIITYILLVATLVLDVRCLLGALASTWTYAFIINGTSWLQSCVGRWHGLRNFVVSLDPSRLFVEEPTSYRRWSGTIGRHNLFRACTHETTSLISRLVKLVATRGLWMEYQYGYLDGLEIMPVVGDLLFEKVWEKLKSAFETDLGAEPDPKPESQQPQQQSQHGTYVENIQESMEQARPTEEIGVDQGLGLRERRKVDEALEIGSEFQEVVLTWHIATEVFLLLRPGNAVSFRHVKAIRELSSYLMFIVAVRPHMVPGLHLPSLYEATHKALKDIYDKPLEPDSSSTNREKDLAKILVKMERTRPGSAPDREKDLAKILVQMETTRPGSEPDSRSTLYDSSPILSDGTWYARLMLKRLQGPNHANKKKSSSLPKHSQLMKLLYGDVLDLQKMLEDILDAWVKFLIHASVRCSRDSHAKQLGRGGELTTIVWILSKHANIDKKTQHD